MHHVQHVRRARRLPPVYAKTIAPDRPAADQIRAPVLRAVQTHARAGELVATVFGVDSSAAMALGRRAGRLAAADVDEVERIAGELHLLATWTSAVAEAVELENAAAADLRPYLAVIMSECELIASIDDAAAA